jgi:hypothetical protein
MALGPRLDIRQTQALVLTPQLTQAIRLLQLSNLELEAVIAEEMAKNPLLETASGEDEPAPAADSEVEIADSLEEPSAPGADELMVSSDGTSDQPLDYDWEREALETDSFADVPVPNGSGDEDGPDFERMEYGADSLAEHLLNQLELRGRRAISHAPSSRCSRTPATFPCPPATLLKLRERRWRPWNMRSHWCRISNLQALGRGPWRNASRFRPRPPTAMTQPWQG